MEAWLSAFQQFAIVRTAGSKTSPDFPLSISLTPPASPTFPIKVSRIPSLSPLTLEPKRADLFQLGQQVRAPLGGKEELLVRAALGPPLLLSLQLTWVPTVLSIHVTFCFCFVGREGDTLKEQREGRGVLWKTEVCGNGWRRS